MRIDEFLIKAPGTPKSIVRLIVTHLEGYRLKWSDAILHFEQDYTALRSNRLLVKESNNVQLFLVAWESGADDAIVNYITPPVSVPAAKALSMREITDHKCNGLNEALSIEAGAPGVGGAPEFYRIDLHPGDKPSHAIAQLQFQSGPIQKPEDANGLSNEALLAVIIDRMRGFQSGPFSCRENALALTKLEEAMMWLQKRTRDRVARGVEGTNKA